MRLSGEITVGNIGEPEENNKGRRQSWTEYRVTVRVAGCVNLLNTPTTQYNSTEAELGY